MMGVHVNTPPTHTPAWYCLKPHQCLPIPRSIQLHIRHCLDTNVLGKCLELLHTDLDKPYTMGVLGVTSKFAEVWVDTLAALTPCCIEICVKQGMFWDEGCGWVVVMRQ